MFPAVNPKHEVRNPKQYQISKYQIFEIKKLDSRFHENDKNGPIHFQQTYCFAKLELFKHKTGVLTSFTEVFTYPKQLVVLADSVCSAKRACLYLADARGNSQVGDCGIFCFAASVAYDRGPAGPAGHINRLESFSERSYLV